MSKIKGSSSAIKMKYLLFVFAAAVLVGLPARVYQLLAIVDTSSGFYKENDITIPVLYGAVIIFCLLFMALSYVSREVPSPKLPTGKNPVLGVASFVLAGGACYDIYAFIEKVVPSGVGNSAIFNNLLKSNIDQAGGLFAVLQVVFAFFSIIYLLVFAISHLNGKASYKEFKLLALAPLCWVMTMLISRLMTAISFSKMSELLFEIFTCVFLMLFFLTFARISSGVFTENSMWGIYGYGLSAAFLGAVVTIPRIVIGVVGLDPVKGYEFNFSHLACVVFVLAYVFASLGVGFKDGLKNRRAINDIALPDDSEAVFKSDDSEADEDDDDKILAEIEAFVAQVDNIESIYDESVDVEEVAAEEKKTGFSVSSDIDELLSKLDEMNDEVEEEEPVKEEVSSGFSINANLDVNTVEDFVTDDEEIPAQIVEESPVDETGKAEAESAEEIPETEVEEIVEESIGEVSQEESDEEAEITVEEKTEPKKRRFFGKTEETQVSDEFVPISLAELKNRQNKE